MTDLNSLTDGIVGMSLANYWRRMVVVQCFNNAKGIRYLCGSNIEENTRVLMVGKMPYKDKELSQLFHSKIVNLERLESDGWHDQGSANYHYGLPRKKNLWLKKISPSHQCGHVTIWLFVFLHLSEEAAIKKIETSVHQVFNDGGYEELDVEFFPPDREAAASEIRNILK